MIGLKTVRGKGFVPNNLTTENMRSHRRSLERRAKDYEKSGDIKKASDIRKLIDEYKVTSIKKQLPSNAPQAWKETEFTRRFKNIYEKVQVELKVNTPLSRKDKKLINPYRMNRGAITKISNIMGWWNGDDKKRGNLLTSTLKNFADFKGINANEYSIQELTQMLAEYFSDERQVRQDLFAFTNNSRWLDDDEYWSNAFYGSIKSVI